jgi:glycosyltransferase involved in cell wall biosynthesis
MKIAIVVPGGVDRSATHNVIPCLLWLIERLAAANEVHVFALQQEARPGAWDLLGARVHNAGTRPRRLRALAQLVAEHRRGRFDVVHAWWAGGPGLVAAMFKRLSRVPVVLTLPGGDLVGLRDIGYGAQLSWRGRVATRAAIRAADRVAVPSGWMQDQAAAAGIGSVRIPLGVALDRWPLAQPKRRSADRPLRLVHVANLNRVKDQSTLLDAMTLLRDRGIPFQLDVIGLDTLDGAIQRRSEQMGLAAFIHFHGFHPHSETRRWVEEADLMVVSSRHETVPLVAVEAAVAGVPTVGTAVGIIADWAADAALAVPVGDSVAFAEAIIALATDEERRLALARASQQRALAEDADFTAMRTLALYRELSRTGDETVR